MAHISLSQKDLLGSYQWEGRLDLFNVVMIGLAKDLPEQEENHKLHRLLGTLLSKELSADGKLSILKTEYQIPLEDNIREDVNVMCNLSQGIREEGRIEGRIQEQQTIFCQMYKNGISIEKIAVIAGMKEEEVRDIIERAEEVCV